MSRNKWKAVDLSLQFSIKTDWSQEDVETPLSDVSSIRSTLPTKTNATRQNAELDNIPENGPFILNYANIPFDSSESDLLNFFRAFEVCDIELNNPRAGCGRISFTNLNDLAGAWKMNEKMFLSRPIRLSIPLKEDIARQQAMGSKNKYQSQQRTSTLNSEDSSNWRSKTTQKELTKESESSSWRSQTSRQQESCAEINSESSNWRNRMAATQPQESVVENSNESSNWRTRSQIDEKPVNCAWRTQAAPVDKLDAWRSREVPLKTVIAENNPNWRPRSTQIEVKSSLKIDDCDNWRRGRGNDEPVPSKHESTKTNTIQEVSADSKKQSVFGDARPVDTTVKDKEIDAKIEKIMTKSDSISRPNPWSTTKAGTVPVNSVTNTDKSSVPEWRVKQTLTPVNRSRTTSDNQKGSLIDNAPLTQDKIEKKPQLAPPPAVNVWTERLKSRATSSSGNTKEKDKVVEVEVRSGDGQGEVLGVGNVRQGEPLGTVINRQGDRQEGEVGAVTGSKDDEHKVGDREQVLGTGTIDNNETNDMHTDSRFRTSETKTGLRSPVVISVNGPYLDPKSHRTLQPHTDNSKTPTAIPITSKTHSNIVCNTKLASSKEIFSNVHTANKSSTSSDSRPINIHSSWAKGPPKGLLDKSLIGGTVPNTINH